MGNVEMLAISLILSGCGLFLGYVMADLQWQVKLHKDKLEAEDAKVYLKEDDE